MGKKLSKSPWFHAPRGRANHGTKLTYGERKNKCGISDIIVALLNVDLTAGCEHDSTFEPDLNNSNAYLYVHQWRSFQWIVPTSVTQWIQTRTVLFTRMSHQILVRKTSPSSQVWRSITITVILLSRHPFRVNQTCLLGRTLLQRLYPTMFYR